MYFRVKMKNILKFEIKKHPKSNKESMKQRLVPSTVAMHMPRSNTQVAVADTLELHKQEAAAHAVAHYQMRSQTGTVQTEAAGSPVR